MLSDERYDIVVNKLYMAGAGSVRWDDALSEISLLLNLWGVQIIGVNKQNGTLLFSLEGGPFEPRAAIDYIRTYHQCNPRIGPSITLGEKEWMHCHEHFDESFVAQDPYYQDFLIPYGGRYLSGTKLIDQEDSLVLLGAHRPVGAAPLDSDDVRVLDRLRRHLVEAVNLHNDLRKKQAELQVGRMVVERLHQSAALIDSEKGIRYLNPIAQRFLDQSELLSGDDGSLRCRNSSDEIRFMNEVRALLVPRYQDDSQGRKVMRLEASPGATPTLLMLSKLDPDKTLQAFGTMPVALVTFYEIGRSDRIDPVIVAEAYRLSPAESRVAVALADGQTPEQIASSRGVAISTIRSQIKASYAKLGVHSEAELVRQLLSLPRF